MCIEGVDDFTLTQPIVSVTERSVTDRSVTDRSVTDRSVTDRSVTDRSVTDRSVIQTVKVTKQVNVITQKKAKRNVHNKQSRCSNTLG